MKSKPLSHSLEAFRSNRVDSCCFNKPTYFSFKSFNSLVLSSKCVRSSLRDSISSSMGILEYTSFSSLELESGSTYDVNVATNPTTTFVSSSYSTTLKAFDDFPLDGRAIDLTFLAGSCSFRPIS